MMPMESQCGFRPQQGLPIMNVYKERERGHKNENSFRPQQGLPIMNCERNG